MKWRKEDVINKQVEELAVRCGDVHFLFSGPWSCGGGQPVSQTQGQCDIWVYRSFAFPWYYPFIDQPKGRKRWLDCTMTARIEQILSFTAESCWSVESNGSVEVMGKGEKNLRHCVWLGKSHEVRVYWRLSWNFNIDSFIRKKEMARWKHFRYCFRFAVYTCVCYSSVPAKESYW